MKKLLLVILILPLFQAWAEPPITFQAFEVNGYHTRITFENLSDKTIEAFEFTIQFFDPFGETINFQNRDYKELRVDIPFEPGRKSFLWMFPNQEQFHNLKAFRLDRVAFSDGTIWINDDGFELLFEVEIREIPRGSQIVVDALAYGNKLNSEGRNWIRIVDEFERLKPNIDIQYELLFEEAYQERVDARLASGNYPDMAYMGMGTPWESSWTNVDQRWDHRKYIDMIYDLSLIPSHVSSGEVFYIPKGTAYMVSILFMNENLVNNLGFSTPETYEDFLAMVPAAQAKGYEIITIDGADLWAWGSCLLPTIIARTSGDPNWFSKAESGEAKFTDRVFINALTIIEMMVQDELISTSSLEVNYAENIEKYSNGEALFMIQGQWAANSITEKEVIDNTLLLAWPELPFEHYETEGTVAAAPFQGYGLSKKGADNIEVRDAALSFINYFNRETEMIKRLELGEIIAPNLANWIIPDDLPHIIKQQVELSQTAGNTQAIDGIFSEDVYTSINVGIQEIVAGTATPEEVARRLEQIIR